MKLLISITRDFVNPGQIVVIHWGAKEGECHDHAVADCGGRDLFPTRLMRTVRSAYDLAVTEPQLMKASSVRMMTGC